ncbi:MAG: LuxR C-terminal-related transcriptional regulator [Actinomycetota bacterium]
MKGRIPVFVYARDPISEAGLVSQLRNCSEVWVVEEGQLDSAAVAVVVADQVDTETLRAITAIQRNGCPRVVAVITQLDDGGLLGAVEAGACGLLRRSEAVPERLVGALERAAAGEGTLPPDLLGRLFAQLGHLHREVLSPRGFHISGLTEREVEVLRMVSDGASTTEIASKLCYSERTIKNVIQDVIMRFQLRNRSHAVAYALRQGLI